MPDQRENNIPDTSETYERGHPDKTPGLGEMDTPEAQKKQADHPDSVQGSTRNDLDSQELTADDIQQQGDVVDPASDAAHGNRKDPADLGDKAQKENA